MAQNNETSYKRMAQQFVSGGSAGQFCIVPYKPNLLILHSIVSCGLFSEMNAAIFLPFYKCSALLVCC